MRTTAALIVAAGLVLTGCYHATVDTGRAPGNEVINEAFASSWIYGLVPPDEVEAAEECTNGVARVETRLSFVNQLVGFLTLGIYTPMEIRVTCAAAGSAGADAPTIHAGEADGVREAFGRAADVAAGRGEAVYVTF